MINVKVLLSQKSYKRDVKFFRNLYREARRSSNGGHHRDSTHQSFLQKLKAGASRQQEQAVPQGGAIGKELCADQLIHRVVTAHIFAKRH